METASRPNLQPFPRLSPAISASSYKNAILNRGAKGSRVHFSNQNVQASGILHTHLSSRRTNQELLLSRDFSVGPLKRTMVTTTQFRGFSPGLPFLKSKSKGQSRSPVPVKAFRDDFFKFRMPVIVEKPEWFWRTLACVPYLIALQISDVGYYLQPFLEHYEVVEDLIYFVPGAIRRWPSWFSMVYCYFGYIGIVKNKHWPHYFRFHLMMGMLLETAMQIIWYTSNFFPLIHYNGRLRMQYWAAIGFTYIFILLECVRCALGGTYANIPFVSDSALIHTLFNIGGYQRPF